MVHEPADGNEPNPVKTSKPVEPPVSMAEKASVAALICAMIGGVGPLLVKVVQNWNPQDAYNSVRNFIIMLYEAEFPHMVASVVTFALPWLGAAACAAFLAYLFKEKNNYRAFVSGMSAPAVFVSLVLSGSSGDTSTKDASVKVVSSLWYPFAVAHAQDQTGSLKSIDSLTFGIQGLPGDCSACAITFFDESGNALGIQPFSEAGSTSQATAVATVPNGAATAIISGIPGTNNAQFSIPETIDALKSVTPDVGQAAPPTINLSREGSFLNSLRIGAGVANVQPYDLNMKLAQ